MWEKNITDPMFTAYCRFFSPVDAYGCDGIRGITFTVPCATLKTVDPAFTGAKAAAI